jgi:chloramphenicol 3-O phosphotransferase
MPHKSSIVVLNGTSSAGKSTLSTALRKALPNFCYFASDQLADENFRPIIRSDEERSRSFDGFHRAIESFADAGCDMIVEHIVEEPFWWEDICNHLRNHSVLWVGVHCPLEIVKQREIARGNRTIGEAEYHIKTHAYCQYDLHVDTSVQTTDDIVDLILQRRAGRQTPEPA